MGFNMANVPQPDKWNAPRNRRAAAMRGSKHRPSTTDTRAQSIRWTARWMSTTLLTLTPQPFIPFEPLGAATEWQR